MPKTKNIKNIEYWRKRLAENQENILRPADDYIIEVETIFKQAENEIKKEIALWYQRFADNNGITDTAEARKRLKGKELAELKWNVAEYIKHGRENGISADWAKELENASARVHINRLEALEFQCRQYIENLYTSFDRDTGMLLENIYTESMYHTAYEIAKGIGIGSNFAAINTEQLKRVIYKPWSADGKNFSQRIWGEHRTKLVNTLHNRLSRGILTGKSPDKIIDEIAKDMKSSKDRASRLVMTESAYFASLSQKESFKKLGVKKYQILGTLDSSTCEDCGELDGKVIELKEFEVAATAPPFHCWCRCTMVPFFDDEFTEGEKRFARDKDGNVIYVSADMTYEDWKKKFVDEGVAKSDKSSIINIDKVNNIHYSTIKNGKMNIVNDKEYWKNATFSSEKKLNRHLKSHLKEYKGYTAEEYINRARELLSLDLNSEIDGFVDKDGFVFKYDIINNDFVIGRPDGYISTLFKPDNKIMYWENQKKYYKEGVTDE